MMSMTRRRVAGLSCLLAFTLCGAATLASAETLMMPDRDTATAANTVVWGVSTQANGTPFAVDFGDGSAIVTGNVTDRSYIAFDHTYALAGTYNAQLCVGGTVFPCAGESATAEVRAYNLASLSLADARNVNINRAIQDGLRYLWTQQVSRTTNFPAGVTTSWVSASAFGQGPPATALVVLAFENHGYLLTNDNAVPTGLYEKYVVQRGLNHLVDTALQQTLTVQTAGNRDPCVGVGIEAAPCVGLRPSFDSGYSAAVVALPFAASNALNRQVPAGLGAQNAGFVAGRTYREILQRIVDTMAWGQNDYSVDAQGNPVNNSGRGGWVYNFSNNQLQVSDGSTVGWDVLALLDAEASGITVPAFVRPEFRDYALPQGLNVDGSFDYRADNNANAFENVNFQKGGIGLQGLFYTGVVGTGNPEVQTSVTYLSDRWDGLAHGNDVFFWACGSPASNNKGCAYGMFNTFKALKLHGVTTLPGVTRGAGPGAIPAGDWHADYEDWLVANQTNPTTAAGGNWGTLGFSCCFSNTSASAALAELILAPVALIQPDPETFSEVGLKQGNPLSVDPMSNPVNTLHTVVASVESSGGGAIPGVEISFQVTGRNSTTGSGVSNASGEVTFSYTDAGPANAGGDDSIQAFIGQVGSNVSSNVLVKHWVVPVTRCDVDVDGDVDRTDLILIRGKNGQVAASPSDPYDGNGDGKINVLDVRYCQLHQRGPAA